MDLLKRIKKRRSIRKFTGEEVPGEVIYKIIEAGRWAPSGLNNQPWKFFVVKDEGLKEAISSCTKYSKIVKSAKVLLLVFLDHASSYHRNKDLMAIGASIQNMLLMVEDLNFGACWLGEILNKKEEVEKLCNTGKKNELVAVIAVGKPIRRPKSASRKSIKEILLSKKQIKIY